MSDTYVYKITRTDDLSYIGITKNLNVRISQHSKSNRFSSGIKNVEILEENISYEEAEKKEEYYIGLYDTYKNGLNVTPDGKGKNKNCKFNTLGFKFSKESRRKMSEAAKRRGMPWLKGYKHSEELKSHWSKIRKGKCWRPRKISVEQVKEIIDTYNSGDISFIPLEFISSLVKPKQKELVRKNLIKPSEYISKNGLHLSLKSIISHWYAEKLKVSHQAIRRIIINHENERSV